MRWRLTDPSMVWRFWDGQILVFHPASGDTHLVQSVAAAVLQSLEGQPLDVEELTARVAERLDRAPESLRDECAALLIELDELGLIEPER